MLETISKYFLPKTWSLCYFILLICSNTIILTNLRSLVILSTYFFTISNWKILSIQTINTFNFKQLNYFNSFINRI